MKRLLLVVGVLAACGGGDDDPFRVTLDTGVIVGTTDGDVRMWRGIPYAAPPVGELRWASPAAVEPWEGAIDTIEPGPACPQSFSALGEASADEDCLYLNVWSPRTADKAPVLVWIHGGAFAVGTGSSNYYSGRHLAETFGVVVVTINYRLGALGFVANPALGGSGNYGLEDQRAALAWVQRNITAFGGNQDRVTIFGESAGGMSTCLLYASPDTDGLFASAISESGLCGDTGTLIPSRAEAEDVGARFATALGCTSGDVAGCMRGKSTAEISASTMLTPVDEQLPGGLFFKPADDLLFLPFVDGTVIPQFPNDLFAAGAYPPRPLLLGSNKDEYSLFQNELLGKPVATELELRDALARRLGSASVDPILAHYSVASFASPAAALSELTGDGFFVCPTRRAARGALANGAAVYQYSFERPIDAPSISDLGVFHSSEIPFVFGTGDVFPLGRVSTGQPTADFMQAAWTQFAATGVPSPDWPAYDAGDMLLVLDNTQTARAGHKAALCDFWDSLQ